MHPKISDSLPDELERLNDSQKPDNNLLGLKYHSSMSSPSEIHVLPPMEEWLPAHEHMFFSHGKASSLELAELLLDGARTLGAVSARIERHVDWWLVGAEQDWFPAARFPVPESLKTDNLVPFPEVGQNCTRPEVLVMAFATLVAVKHQDIVSVAKGSVAETDPVIALLREASRWKRAIAFKGVD